MKKLSMFAIVGVLATSLTLGGCSTSQFDAVLNVIGPAIADIIQIVAIVKGAPANTSIVTKIDADVAAVEKLDADFVAAGSAAQPGIQAAIQAGFQTLNADLGSVFTVAQVSDPATQAKISALVSLVETGVNLAEATINAAAPAQAKASLTAKALKHSFNAMLVSPVPNAAVNAFTAKHKI
jgi:hypothetical protein